MRKTLLAASIASLLGFSLAACQEAPQQGAAPVDQRDHDATSARQAEQANVADSQESAELSARLNDWFDEKFEEQLQQSPLRMTMLGRKDRYDEIDDISLESQRERFAWLESTVEELQREFDYQQLDQDAQISYDIWMFQYELARDGMDFIESGYVFDQMRGAHTSLPQVLLAYHSVSDESDMRAYISRVAAIGTTIEKLTEQAQARAEDNIRPPRFAYEYVIRQSGALIQGAPFDDAAQDSPIYADAQGKIEGLRDDGELDEETAQALHEDLRGALNDHFAPAYQGLIEWLESDLENTAENTVGISRHDGGDSYYEYMLRMSTTTDLSAAEIHQIGLDEVERITGEMNEIREQVGFEGDLDAFFEFIRTDERFFFPNTDEGAEAYLEQSREYLDNIEGRLPEFFGRLPKADLVVRRVEPYREQDGAPQHYYLVHQMARARASTTLT